MATLTYKSSVDALRLFVRSARHHGAGDGPSAEVTKFFGNEARPIDKLFAAIYLNAGDFTDDGAAKFPDADKEITQALWYVRAAGDKQPPTPPAAFSYDDMMRTAGMLAFAIPVAGAAVAGAIGMFQAAVDNLSQRLVWLKSLSQVDNPPDNPYQTVIDALKAKIDDAGLRGELADIYAQIATIQGQLNKTFVSPRDLKTGSVAIKPSPATTKSYLLGANALGGIFALERKSAWRKLAGADQQWINGSFDAQLNSNPTYAMVSLSAFVHFVVSVVTGLLAYALLYPLPEKAFQASWDHTDDTGKPYDAKAAIRSTKGQPRGEYPSTAWDALELLDDVLPRYIQRLDDAQASWRQIYDRLGKVDLETGQPARRNGLYYLAQDSTRVRELSMADSFITANLDNVWAEATDKAVTDGQVVLSDPAQPLDQFASAYRHFHTHLRLGWGIATDVKALLYTLPQTVTPITTQIPTLVRDWSAFTYPMKHGGAHDGSDASSYNDVFWTPASSNDAALGNARLPGFLQSSQGRDVCAWLGFVLAKYCDAYRYEIDTTLRTTLSDAATGVKGILDAVHALVKTHLGEDAGLGGSGSPDPPPPQPSTPPLPHPTNTGPRPPKWPKTPGRPS